MVIKETKLLLCIHRPQAQYNLAGPPCYWLSDNIIISTTVVMVNIIILTMITVVDQP